MKQASRWSLALLVTVSLPVLRAQAEQPVIAFPQASGSSTATISTPEATEQKTVTTKRKVTRSAPTEQTTERTTVQSSTPVREAAEPPPTVSTVQRVETPAPSAPSPEATSSAPPVRHAAGAPPVRTAPVREEPTATVVVPTPLTPHEEMVRAAPPQPLTPEQKAARDAAGTWDRGRKGQISQATAPAATADTAPPERLWPQVQDMWPQPPSDEVPVIERRARPRVGTVVPRPEAPPPAPFYGGGPPPGYPPYPAPGSGGFFDFGR